MFVENIFKIFWKYVREENRLFFVIVGRINMSFVYSICIVYCKLYKVGNVVLEYV